MSTDNQYGGTFVSPNDLPETKGQFAATLNESISNWHAKQIKVVWLKIPKTKSEFLPIAYKAGFENHHCDNEGIVLTKRLVKNALIPSFAHHTIGVGGLVINEQNEVLTIREKAHVDKYPHNWKFPGGMLDPFEDFATGVMREVKEETNIDTQFVSFVGFRHHHKGQFNTSNIYAICKLEPLSYEITIQESEIHDAKWFPIDEYLADQKIGRYNHQVLRSALASQGMISTKLDGYMEGATYEVFLNSAES